MVFESKYQAVKTTTATMLTVTGYLRAEIFRRRNDLWIVKLSSCKTTFNKVFMIKKWISIEKFCSENKIGKWNYYFAEAKDVFEFKTEELHKLIDLGFVHNGTDTKRGNVREH